MTSSSSPPHEPTKESPDTLSEMLMAELAEAKRNRVNKVLTGAISGLALVISLGTVVGGYSKVLGDAKAQTKEQVDAGLEPQDKRLTLLEEAHKQDRAANSAFQVRQEDSNYRASLELRALQTVILTRQPSPLLLEPPVRPRPRPDGGR